MIGLTNTDILLAMIDAEYNELTGVNFKKLNQNRLDYFLNPKADGLAIVGDNSGTTRGSCFAEIENMHLYMTWKY